MGRNPQFPHVAQTKMVLFPHVTNTEVSQPVPKIIQGPPQIIQNPQEEAWEWVKSELKHSVLRGETLEQLLDSYMGHGEPGPKGRSFSIGGYSEGKKVPRGKVVVQMGRDTKPVQFYVKDIMADILKRSSPEQARFI